MKIHFNAFLRTVALASSLTYAASCAVHAATGTWSGAFDGTWDTSDVNWSAVSGTPWDVTNGPDNTATFNTASLAVTVSGPVYTNGIAFSATGGLSGSSINLVGVNPTISVATGQTGTISAIVGGSAGLIKSDAGLLTLSGATYTGGTTVIGGRLVLENTKTGSSNFISDSELEFNLTTGDQQLISGTISGTGSLVKTGGNNLILSDWSGNQTVALTGAASIIDVQAGTLSNFFAAGIYGPAVNWAGNKAGLTIAFGATFDLTNNSVTVDELNGAGTINKDTWDTALTLTIGVNDGSGTFSGTILNPKNSLAVVKEGTGTQTLSGGNIGYKGGTTVNGGRLVLENTLTGNTSYTINSELEFSLTTANQQLQSGTFSGIGKLVKTGENELILSNWGGAQTVALTGANSVIDVQAGVLSNFSASAFGAPHTNWAGNKAGLTVASGATFEINNTSVIVDELSGAGTINKGTWDTAVTLTIGVNDGSGTFSGVIAQPVGTPLLLVKQGTGTQTLSGVNTYSGTTAVNAGKLIVEGSIANTAVTVSNSGTILASDAAASIGTSLTIDSGAILAPGDAAAAGTITVGGASTFNDASIFSWDINATGSAYDKIVTSGTVDGGSAGGAVFRVVVSDNTFANGFWAANQTWNDIFTTDGTIAISDWAAAFGSAVSLVDSNFSPIAPVAGAFTLSGNTLTWSAVPEPTTALAGLLIGAGLFRRRR